MKPTKITEGVYSLRVNHFNRRLFDSLIPLPEGTSYNAYLVKGSEKTALMDSRTPDIGPSEFVRFSPQTEAATR